jgi:hypothetical protein
MHIAIGILLAASLTVVAIWFAIYFWRLTHRILVEQTDQKPAYEKLRFAKYACFREFYRMNDNELSFRWLETDDNHIAFQAVKRDQTVEATFAFTGPDRLINDLHAKITEYLARPELAAVRPAGPVV